MKFFQKPANCCAASSLLVAVGSPCEKPVPTGCSTHTMLVSVAQFHGLYTGFGVPYCHEIGPFSCKKPSREEHPGPCGVSVLLDR